MDAIADLLNRIAEGLVGRASGPMHLRLVIQPIIASIIAIRAGLRDARNGRPAFLWSALTNSSERRSLVRSGWEDIGKVFTAAFFIDIAYQIFVIRGFQPLQSLTVAVIVAVVPYLILRGLVTRASRRLGKTPSTARRAA